MNPCQPCTIWDDIAAVIANEPLISDVATRIKWLRLRHKPPKRLQRYLKLQKAKDLRAA